MDRSTRDRHNFYRELPVAEGSAILGNLYANLGNSIINEADIGAETAGMMRGFPLFFSVNVTIICFRGDYSHFDDHKLRLVAAYFIINACCGGLRTSDFGPGPEPRKIT